MKRFRNKKGSILAEALVAVTTLIAGVVAVSTIINNAISATVVSKDYLVAENLANEAVESIKIIRDTNIMKWPQFMNDCWLVANPSAVNDPASCRNNWVRVNANYLSTKNNSKWALVVSSQQSDLNLGGQLNAQGAYRLYLKTMGQAPNQYTTYLHAAGAASKFYRSVKAISVNANSADFEVKVQWLDGVKVREIIRSYTIYNYL